MATLQKLLVCSALTKAYKIGKIKFKVQIAIWKWNLRQNSVRWKKKIFEILRYFLLVEDIKRAIFFSKQKRTKFFKKIARDQANYVIHRSESTGTCRLCLTRQLHKLIITQFNWFHSLPEETNERVQTTDRHNCPSSPDLRTPLHKWKRQTNPPIGKRLRQLPPHSQLALPRTQKSIC